MAVNYGVKCLPNFTSNVKQCNVCFIDVLTCDL